MNILQSLLLIVGLAAFFAAGYVVGRHNGREAMTAVYDRLLQLEPLNRTPGLPTNIDAEPSVPRSPRWRNGTFYGSSPRQ